MAISDVELSEFSKFSYLNLSPGLKDKFDRKIPITIKEVADYYIENPEFYFKNITEINGKNLYLSNVMVLVKKIA